MDFFEELKERFRAGWQAFKYFVFGHQKLTIGLLAGILILLTASLLFGSRVSAGIRQSELDELVYRSYSSDKILFFGANADEEIQAEAAISVIFAVPNGKLYEEVNRTLEDKEQLAGLTHKAYLYPVVYDKETVMDEYQLKDGVVTMIFFEKGVEKRRYEITADTVIDQDLIPELNRLPMPE